MLIGGGKTIRTCSEHKACSEPLQIPFPGTGKSLIEIVDIKNQAALRRLESAKVKQVGIAAELRMQGRHRCGRQVCGHDVGGASIKSKRRNHHAPVADRNELRNAAFARLDYQLDRIASVSTNRPFAMLLSCHS